MEKIAPVKLGRNVQNVVVHLSFVVGVTVSLSHVVAIRHVSILKRKQKKRLHPFRQELNVRNVKKVKSLKRKHAVEKSSMDVINIQAVIMHFGINQLIRNVQNAIAC